MVRREHGRAGRPGTTNSAIIMQIKWGGGVVKMSGKVAGTYFSNTAVGSQMKAISQPTTAVVVNGSAPMSATAYCNYAWNYLLTDAERAAWTATVKSNGYPILVEVFGITSGINAFIKVNWLLVTLGANIRRTPIYKSEEFNVDVGLLDYQPAIPSLTLSYLRTTADHTAVCYITSSVLLPQGSPSSMQKTAHIATIEEQNSPIDLTAAYINKYGVMPSNQPLIVQMNIRCADVLEGVVTGYHKINNSLF